MSKTEIDETFEEYCEWVSKQLPVLNIFTYFVIFDCVNGGYGFDGVLSINPSGEFKPFSRWIRETKYNTVAEARLSANQYYAQELLTLVPEFTTQDVKPLYWESDYTEMDATVEVEHHGDGYKVVGRLQVYMKDKLTTIDMIDSVTQGEKPYASIDEALIAAKRFMGQLVVNNLIKNLEENN